jgi:hypothetical protein
VLYTNVFDVFDREGAMAMGVAFAIAPAVALIVGLATAIWAWMRTSNGKVTT